MIDSRTSALADRAQLHSSVEQNVLDLLRTDIVHLVLEPGQRLSLEEFSERYGASLTPFRQALRHLKTEGLVTFIPRRGSFVAPLSADDLDLIMTVSAGIESRLTVLGVPALTDDDLEQLPIFVRQRAEAAADGDIDGIYRATWGARDLIAQRADRRLLMAEATKWRKRIERYQRFLRRSVRAPEYEARWSSDFSSYVEAAAARNGEAAAAHTQATVGWALQEIARELQRG
jgi:DNA-binding GntR family transcriptional regulator